jgi:hypothetical protein
MMRLRNICLVLEKLKALFVVSNLAFFRFRIQRLYQVNTVQYLEILYIYKSWIPKINNNLRHDGCMSPFQQNDIIFPYILTFLYCKQAVGESCALPLKYYGNNVTGSANLMEVSCSLIMLKHINLKGTVSRDFRPSVFLH